MKSSFLVAIDQGTTGSRAVLFDRNGVKVATAYQEYRQIYPHPGWVEHDANEIWRSVVSVLSRVLKQKKIHGSQIAALGITNQRETTVVWNRKTGRPYTHAIVWQDRRTADFCEGLKKKGLEANIRHKTGLVLDPYFSASKIHWLLKHHPPIRRDANRGRVAFGTIDSWLLWKLTGGAVHATDYTNASRTLLFNIRTRRWDRELLKTFQIPSSILPKALPSGSLFGKTVRVGPLPAGIPIHAMIGDQQAALYGQGCYRKGEGKNTYGTGSFIVMNLGKKLPQIPKGLLATLACDASGNPVFALEGSIFISGAAVQWLRDGLAFFSKAKDSEKMIRRLKDSGNVVVIPAFVGLGSPYWNPHVRGAIFGLTRGSRREHIIRATLESIAHQCTDVIDAMSRFSGKALHELKADGGATSNRFLMQCQSDYLGMPVLTSDILESTAWGAAKLAGYASGFWPDLAKLDKSRRYVKYLPKMKPALRKRLRDQWRKYLDCLLKTA